MDHWQTLVYVGFGFHSNNKLEFSIVKFWTLVSCCKYAVKLFVGNVCGYNIAAAEYPTHVSVTSHWPLEPWTCKKITNMICNLGILLEETYFYTTCLHEMNQTETLIQSSLWRSDHIIIPPIICASNPSLLFLYTTSNLSLYILMNRKFTKNIFNFVLIYRWTWQFDCIS